MSILSQYDLLRSLSTPSDTPAIRNAAAQLMSDPDRQSKIEHLYPALIRHKTLVVALDHLERVGADLASIFIPGTLFRSAWPFNRVFGATQEAKLNRVSLASLRRLAAVQEELLTQVEDGLEGFSGDFILLFGRALRVAYPSYREGLSHDVDIFVPSITRLAPMLEFLCTRMGFAVLQEPYTDVEKHRLAGCKALKISAEGHHLSVDMICSGRSMRPGLLPRVVLDLGTRTRTAIRCGRSFLVPSREDMLLMVAEKTKRRAEFTRRHVNDVAFILRCEEGPLDWGYIAESARRHQMNAVLLHLLEVATTEYGRVAVPADVLAALTPTRIERHVMALMVPRSENGERGLGTGRRDPGLRARRRWRIWHSFWVGKRAMGILRSPRATFGLALYCLGSIFRSLQPKHLGRAVPRGTRRLASNRDSVSLPNHSNRSSHTRHSDGGRTSQAG